MLHSRTLSVAALCGALSASPTPAEQNASSGFNLSNLFDPQYNVAVTALFHPSTGSSSAEAVNKPTLPVTVTVCNPDFVAIEIPLNTHLLAPFPDTPVSYQVVGDTSNGESLRAKSLAIHFNGKDKLNLLEIAYGWGFEETVFELPPLTEESKRSDAYEQLKKQDPNVVASSHASVMSVGQGDVIANMNGSPGLKDSPWIDLKHFRAPAEQTRFPYYLFPELRDACKQLDNSGKFWAVYDFVPAEGLMDNMQAAGTYNKGA